MSKYRKADYLAAFRERDGDVELDTSGRGGGTVSLGGDDGAYVRAWVWVSDEQVRRMKGE